jgi:hypothetical protein
VLHWFNLPPPLSGRAKIEAVVVMSFEQATAAGFFFNRTIATITYSFDRIIAASSTPSSLPPRVTIVIQDRVIRCFIWLDL